MPLTHQQRPMRFVTLENGCMVCISHLPNHDGYLRKSWGNARYGTRIMEMFHRTIFRMHKGPIPPAYEVDHTCQNRRCCNPEHLRLLTRDEHRADSNSNRARKHKGAA